jgi:hypothetical protein
MAEQEENEAQSDVFFCIPKFLNILPNKEYLQKYLRLSFMIQAAIAIQVLDFFQTKNKTITELLGSSFTLHDKAATLAMLADEQFQTLDIPEEMIDKLYEELDRCSMGELAAMIAIAQTLNDLVNK